MPSLDPQLVMLTEKRLYVQVFIYTCPSSSKIRERMLYSSSKANVVTAAENDAGVKVTKKVSYINLSDNSNSWGRH